MTDMHLAIRKPPITVGSCVAVALAWAAPAQAQGVMQGVGVPAVSATVPGIRQKLSRAAYGWASLQEKIANWGKLPLDWDGEGGITPSERVLKNARGFLLAAQQTGVPIPAPYVSGDGEVGYVWRRPSGFASASFLADGSIVAKVSNPNRPPFRIDEVFSEEAKTGVLLQRIAELG